MEGLLDLNNLNYDTIFVVKNLRFLRLQIDFNSFGHDNFKTTKYSF